MIQGDNKNHHAQNGEPEEEKIDRNQPGLIVVCGATATGKTSLAIELAQRLGSIVISADSRLVYRGFDIGTAKPTQAERQGVPHYAIDICDPREILTVADYQAQVRAIIAEQHAEWTARSSSSNSNNSSNSGRHHPCASWPILAGGDGTLH
ncbi:MAG: hypothetical protein HC795_12810 [Coleofasciculaceae cyanobacterium RL_1_1]|nr:hypothetical protein [Coleofasciculaceae cyanobacterium RL_1_1]